MVLIADHERRIQGRRFISLKHIMFGLSLSRVGEAVQKILNDRGLNKFTEKPPKMPIYFIYMLSSEAARSLGNFSVFLFTMISCLAWVNTLQLMLDGLNTFHVPIRSFNVKSVDVEWLNYIPCPYPIVLCFFDL